MTIHNEHPFQPPESGRDPIRRLRGRLPAAVSVITAGQDDQRAGLTVSSLLVADGDPAVMVAMIDQLADLYDALGRTGRAVVNLLDWPQHQLAEAFGFQAPAPGGPFRMAQWQATDWGPALVGASWAGCRLRRPPEQVGWAMQVQLAIEQVRLGGGEPMVHHRGRYRRLAD